ncbi:BZ3500-MvSof-1268-A1-R1-Chr3-1g05649 protein [Mycena indigotica]|uniref:BZ3500-MvSof-1268-A1-R1-Chr3-1g05649 protein n=1 Tax=Mycena indigotica TaxID=2126181 RepID=A0A8H6T757_9AGAR|nr:BZ3500-MvSof-1268-A1-R1-Chr3-1g05649 protein [Mycena indigotica]KAF7312308.1 BZ3500-MvSof-1268-A1-R1-Chr3-1g05649 protein [Mycena indigotica]
MRLIPAIVVLFSPIFAVALTVNTPPLVKVYRHCLPTSASFMERRNPTILPDHHSWSALVFFSLCNMDLYDPGGQISALPLKSFDPTDAAFVTWTVDIAVGTAITFSLKDNTGDTAFSDQVTVLAGSDSSCVNSSSSLDDPEHNELWAQSVSVHLSGTFYQCLWDSSEQLGGK